MTVRIAYPDDIDECLRLRREVFVDEQQVPPADEEDGLDASATHLIALAEGECVGTARIRFPYATCAKVERVAVKAKLRGRGLGAKLMDCAEALAQREGCREVLLHAQIDVVPFYEQRGYRAEGEVFMDAGIAHRTMRKRFARGLGAAERDSLLPEE